MRSVKYEMLSDAERSQWEALDAETYEESDYRVFMDEESYSVIQDICTAALYDNFGWMLNLAFIHGGVISRNEHNPEFCRLLRRAYEHAVASGDAGACCNLGNMYHNTSGTGTTEDYAAAIKIYELGVDRGDAQSSVNLGYIYYYGRGVAVDYAKAYECYARAAILDGHPEALWKLGDLYAGGRGVRQSDWTAWIMYSKALENGEESSFSCRAAHHVADYLMKGIEGKLDPDPVKALELYVKAEVGYYAAIDAGLTYYFKCLQQAIEGQARARKAIEERRCRLCAGEEHV